MKTYLPKEVINKLFDEGLHEIEGEKDSLIAQIIENNSVNSKNLMNEDYLELKRLYLFMSNNKLILNFQDEYVTSIMSSNVVSYEEKSLLINAPSLDIWAGGYSSNINLYYKDDNQVLIIGIIDFSNYSISEEYLYDEIKIKNTFYMYLDRTNKRFYNEIIFKIFNLLYPQNIYSLKEKADCIHYIINKNITKVTLPDGREGIVRCHPQDKFNFDEGLLRAFLRAIDREEILKK